MGFSSTCRSPPAESTGAHVETVPEWRLSWRNSQKDSLQVGDRKAIPVTDRSACHLLGAGSTYFYPVRKLRMRESFARSPLRFNGVLLMDVQRGTSS